MAVDRLLLFFLFFICIGCQPSQRLTSSQVYCIVGDSPLVIVIAKSFIYGYYFNIVVVVIFSSLSAGFSIYDEVLTIIYVGAYLGKCGIGGRGKSYCCYCYVLNLGNSRRVYG